MNLLAAVGLLSVAAWLGTDSRRQVFSRCDVCEVNFENFCGEIVAVREDIPRERSVTQYTQDNSRGANDENLRIKRAAS